MPAWQFVLELGRALHALGSASYRVEDAMYALCRHFQLRGSFFATPTAIFATMGGDGDARETALLRVRPGEQDLGKLAALYEVRDLVMHGTVAAEEGLRRLRAVLAAPPTQSHLLCVPAWALGAAASAVFLGGGLAECVVAAATGLLVALFGWLTHGSRRLDRVFQAGACAFAAFVVPAAAQILPFDRGIAMVASIVPLLPGLAFTTALSELATHHLASGSARLLGAVTGMLTMAVGIGLGGRAGLLVFGNVPNTDPSPLPAYAIVLSVLVAALAFAVLLRARWSQVPWVLLAVLLSFLGARLGTHWFERELGASVGALAVTLAGNLYARWRRPAAVLRTPGLLLLVPGSLGLRGLSAAFQGEFTAGSEFAFRMVMVGGSIVAGLLAATVLLPPPLDVEDSDGVSGELD